MQTIRVSFRPPYLPEAFTKEVRAEKTARAYAYVYDRMSFATAGS
ncbi:MAG: hypothetical protein U1F25_12790 [Rubrivivax sp.]